MSLLRRKLCITHGRRWILILLLLILLIRLLAYEMDVSKTSKVVIDLKKAEKKINQDNSNIHIVRKLDVDYGSNSILDETKNHDQQRTSVNQNVNLTDSLVGVTLKQMKSETTRSLLLDNNDIRTTKRNDFNVSTPVIDRIAATYHPVKSTEIKHSQQFQQTSAPKKISNQQSKQTQETKSQQFDDLHRLQDQQIKTQQQRSQQHFKPTQQKQMASQQFQRSNTQQQLTNLQMNTLQLSKNQADVQQVIRNQQLHQTQQGQIVGQQLQESNAQQQLRKQPLHQTQQEQTVSQQFQQRDTKPQLRKQPLHQTQQEQTASQQFQQSDAQPQIRKQPLHQTQQEQTASQQFQQRDAQPQLRKQPLHQTQQEQIVSQQFQLSNAQQQLGKQRLQPMDAQEQLRNHQTQPNQDEGQHSPQMNTRQQLKDEIQQRNPQRQLTLQQFMKEASLRQQLPLELSQRQQQQQLSKPEEGQSQQQLSNQKSEFQEPKKEQTPSSELTLKSDSVITSAKSNISSVTEKDNINHHAVTNSNDSISGQTFNKKQPSLLKPQNNQLPLHSVLSEKTENVGSSRQPNHSVNEPSHSTKPSESLTTQGSLDTTIHAQQQQNPTLKPPESSSKSDASQVQPSGPPQKDKNQNSTPKSVKDSDNIPVNNGAKDSSDQSNISTTTSSKTQPFTVMVKPVGASRMMNSSTIWPQIGCTRPLCKLQDIKLAQRSMQPFMTVDQNVKDLCPTPNETLIDADNSTIDLVELKEMLNTELGGRWGPSDCRPPQKVALMVPYRNRATMLGTWLRHIHQFLQKQNLEYTIYVVEQDDDAPFNRATLLNIAAKFAMKTDDYNCLINHDIDQLPLNLQNLYTCSENPKIVTHYARNVSCRPEEPWQFHFGMVASLTPSQFLSVNGYSNLYFGWGSEDDDMSLRLRNNGYNISLRTQEVGKYECLSHIPVNKKNDRKQFFDRGQNRVQKEGFQTLNYEVLAYSETPLFTWIYVHIDKETARNKFKKLYPSLLGSDNTKKTKSRPPRNRFRKRRTKPRKLTRNYIKHGVTETHRIPIGILVAALVYGCTLCCLCCVCRRLCRRKSKYLHVTRL